MQEILFDSIYFILIYIHILLKFMCLFVLFNQFKVLVHANMYIMFPHVYTISPKIIGSHFWNKMVF